MFSVLSTRLEGGIAHGIRGLHASLLDVHAPQAQPFSDNTSAARVARPLVPVHGPVCWRRKQSTRKIDIDEKFAEPTPIDPDEWESQPRHIKRQYARAPQPHRPAKGGNSRQVIGQRLRTALENGVELRDLIDNDKARHLLGLRLEGPNNQEKWSRQRLEFAAAATATLGKYTGSAVSDQYLDAEDLSNELDGYMEEHKQDSGELDEFEHVPDALNPGLQPPNSEIVRKTSKMEPLAWIEMSDFERRLARNPYAQQLLSPVRLDILCNTRLPKDLMASFNTKMHKQTGELRVVPISIQLRSWERRYLHGGHPLSLRAVEPHFVYTAPKPRRNRTIDLFHTLLEYSHKRGMESAYALRRVERTWSDSEVSDVEDEGDPAKEREGIDAANSGIHVLCAPPLISTLPTLPSKWQNYLSRRFSEVFGPQIGKNVKVRDDIYEHVMKLMRRRTARYLASLEHTGQPVLLPFERDVQAFRSAAGVASAAMEEPTDPDLTEEQLSEVGGRDGGALLWFGQRWGDHFPYSDDAILPQAPETGVDGPAPCQTPIYNMQQLLTETEYNWLRSLKYTTDEGSHASVYNSRQVLVRDSVWSTWPLDWVWRLHLTLTSGSTDDELKFN